MSAGCVIERVDSYEPEMLASTAGRLLENAVRELTCDSRAPFVCVKPNWIQESHEFRPDEWESVITHPAVVASVVGVVAEQIGGVGTICICDAPHTYASFERIVSRADFVDRLEAIRRRWPGLMVECVDLRREVWERREEVVVRRMPNKEDPRGYVRLDLGRDSLFFGHPGEGRYYGADYDQDEVNSHHQGTVQEYLLAGSSMKCDLFINVAKLKTHKKTGITCALKNLVGINGDKNWLPHHVEGGAAEGGDEYPALTWREQSEAVVKRRARRLALRSPLFGGWVLRKLRNTGKQIFGDSESTIRNGNWLGNDTCWRMALDLNRALLYGNPEGSWREAESPKPYIAIVDGIVGGEGNGPLCPDPVQSNVLLAGTNPAEVDAVACHLMGFDPRELPIVARAFDEHRWPIGRGRLEDVVVFDGREGRTIRLDQVTPAVPGGFRPHFGWSALKKAS